MLHMQIFRKDSGCSYASIQIFASLNKGKSSFSYVCDCIFSYECFFIWTATYR